MVQLLLRLGSLRRRLPKYPPKPPPKLTSATYIPVTLEQLASERGVLYSDLTTPCRPADPGSLVRRFADGDRCVFQLFGTWWIDTASFALYVFSVSVLLQALVVISMSGAADHGIPSWGRG
jgi:UMF1 family MFS transporter